MKKLFKHLKNKISQSKKYFSIIILIPGAFSSGTKFYISPSINMILSKVEDNNYFAGYIHLLKKNNLKYLICTREEDKDNWTIQKRTNDCLKVISNFLIKNPKANITIIGHSTGGIVLREILKHNILNIKYALTIATPHRGTPLANYIINNKTRSFFSKILVNILNLFDISAKKRPYLKQIQMSKKANSKRNAILTSITNVQRYSILTGLNDLSFPLNITDYILRKQLSKNSTFALNDGFVPRESQRFGKIFDILNISHFESACHGIFEDTSGCNKLKQSLQRFFYLCCIKRKL